MWWSIWRHYETFQISENVKQLDYVKMTFYCMFSGIKMKINFYFVLDFTTWIVSIWFSSLHLSSTWNQLILEYYKKLDSSKTTYLTSFLQREDVKIQIIILTNIIEDIELEPVSETEQNDQYGRAETRGNEVSFNSLRNQVKMLLQEE